MDETLTNSIILPGGFPVRGRGLRYLTPPGPSPAFGLYLGSRRLRRRHEAHLHWAQDWIVWPDFWVPANSDHATAAIVDLHRRSGAGAPVEVACGGGVGRTGTVVACLAVLDGLTPGQAIDWARAHHHRKAVETPWQRSWISNFAHRAAADV